MRVFARAFARLADPLVFLPLWLFAAISSLLASRLLSDLIAWMQDQATSTIPNFTVMPPFDPGRTALAVLVLLLLGGSALFGLTFGGASFLLALSAMRDGGPPAVGGALATAAVRLPGALGAFAAIAAALMATTFTVAFVSAFMGPGALIPALVLNSAVAVWLLLHLGFAVHLVFDGKEGMFDALAASWRAVSGRALQLLGVVVAAGVVETVVSFFAALLVGAVAGEVSPTSPLAALASTAAAPFVALVTAGLYLEFTTPREAEEPAESVEGDEEGPRWSGIVVPDHKDGLEERPEDDGPEVPPPRPVPPAED